MNDREINALVAEKVMGWRWVDYRWYDGSIKKLLWDDEPQPHGDDFDRLGNDHNKLVPWGLPHFTTDPAADYSVLVRVREGWDDGQQYKFLERLHMAWRTRRPDEPGKWTPIRYEPGDYARAALQALGITVEEATNGE